MKRYLKNINKNYSSIKVLKYALVLSVFLLIIDVLNLPSKYMMSYDMSLILLGIGAIILMLVLIALEFNLVDALKIASINLIDGLSITIIFSCIMYGSISVFYNLLYLYKLIGVISVACFIIIIMIVRGTIYKRYIVNAEKYRPNIVDLKEIFIGDFLIKEDEIILVNEKDVDYDLLKRGNIINQLYNAILQSNPDGKFVISLEGKWGCGKTTILNNVKRKLAESNQNIIIIDEFDPWSYCDQKSLFFNMFDLIIEKSGLKYSTLATKQMTDQISENIFGSKKTRLILKNFFKQQDNISVLKNKINEYLKLCGKKVVFFY